MLSMTSEPLVLLPPADFQTRFPDVVRLAQYLSLRYVHHYVVSEPELQTVGDALWRTVADAARLDAARHVAGTALLPLVIESADPLVQSLPWECLHHPQYGFLGKQHGFTLSRRLAAADTLPPTLPTGPLQVLLFTSMPDDLDAEKERLDVESEQARVLEALDPLIQDGRVQLTTPDDGRFTHFQALLRQQPFQLVFLSGHGEFREDPLRREPPKAVFIFEGEDGHAESVEGGRLVQAVVLSACQSGKSSSDALGASLAVQLLNSGLPHVVGMRESILDLAGIRFAQALCTALGRQERLDVALQEARAAIAQPLDLAGAQRDAAKAGQAELTWGQWCLPLLYSRDPARPLIDWTFQPVPPEPPLLRYEERAGMSLPQTFIGRRRALRELGRELHGGGSRQWLITAAGGQGKTSLAGRIAQRLESDGYLVRAYTARQEQPWQGFVASLMMALEPALREEVNQQWGQLSPLNQARLLVRALLRQTQNKLVLVLDNLESVQDPATNRMTDDAIAVWLAACQPVAGSPAPILLLTSRWIIPGWEGPGRRHYPLPPPSYGDFLRYHQHLAGARWELERLRRLYKALAGNFKGLELFHGLSQVAADEDAFLQQLEQAQTGLQLYMAVAKLFGYLQPPEQELLNRLRAYQAPVIADGVRLIAKGLEKPEDLLRRLTGLSLVDVEWEPELGMNRYRLSPVVADWLAEQREAPALALRQQAARYQHWVFEHLRSNLDQVLIAHEALRQAELDEEAARLALGIIVPNFNRSGLYHTLLKEWLPALRESQEQAMKGEAFNWSGTICIAVGEYAEAMKYLEQSLAICRALGDRAGEEATLNNIGWIYYAQGDYARALWYLEDSLAINRAIGNRAGEGVTLDNIGLIYHAQGDSARALRYWEESLAISRAIGDQAGEGRALNNISLIYRSQGDSARALRYWEESLAIFRAIGDRAVEGTTLNNIGWMYQAQGDSARALRYYEESLAIFRALGKRAEEGAVLSNIGEIYQVQGDSARALRYWEESLAISRAIGDQAGSCVTLFRMGCTHLMKQEPDQAIAAFVAVYRIARDIGLAGALQNLDNLAKQLGGTGLETWEALAQQLPAGEAGG